VIEIDCAGRREAAGNCGDFPPRTKVSPHSFLRERRCRPVRPVKHRDSMAVGFNGSKGS